MCVNELPQVDTDNQFAAKMLEILNGAGLALMVSMGHRCGIFDAMSKIPASTSDEIAKAANLNERYVREWLGAMVTGGILFFDENTQTYILPDPHAQHLTRAAGGDNMASVAQFIAVLGGVEDDIVECFRHGGGVPYSAYPRFHEVMAEESHHTVVLGMESILPLVDGLHSKLSDGGRVLDVGCGRGQALLEMAEKYPNSHFVGYDFSAEAIDFARADTEKRGLSNVEFRVQDAAQFDDPQTYDLVTAFDAIHDQVEPEKVLRAIRRSLKIDGTFLMQDIQGSTHVQNNLDHPLAPLLYTISCMHCMTVSLSAGGAGLGAMWGREKALEMLKEAGFDEVEVNELPHDVMNYYYVSKAA